MCLVIRDNGVILRPLGDVIVILPPLAISVGELGEMLEIVKDCIDKELHKIINA